MNEAPWWHDDEGRSSARDPDAQGADALGSAAVEAARLFEAVRGRILSDPNAWSAGLRLFDAFSGARGSGAHSAAPGAAPECAYCPVCQAIRGARGMSPETVERLTGAALEFAETVRRTVATEPEPSDSTVRHVPLDDDSAWPESSHDVDSDRRPDGAESGQQGQEGDGSGAR